MRLTIYLSLIFTLFLGCSVSIVAQNQYTISGTLRAADTGEILIGASAFITGTTIGATTNTHGFYSFRVTPGTYTVQFSYVGYETITRQITLSRNLRLNMSLPLAGNQLKEVVIEGGSLREKFAGAQMSIEQLTAREAKLLPALFGEVDILKTLQLKPGVQSGGEGTSGLYVRGGGPDQNLFLLDDATVYNASHLFGFFSVFNSDAVRSVDLYKGGFPAQFGGRLSSVVDVKLREGDTKKFGATGGIGLIASRLTLEGPIKKGKSSFIVSGRRTYADVFTRMANRANKDKEDYNPIPDYYFYDLNAKANFNLGPKDNLYLSGYLGNDIFGFRNSGFKFDFGWGNKVASLRWNHAFNSNLFVNTTLSTSSYKYTITNKLDIFSFNLRSDIQDYTLKTDLDYLPGNAHKLKLGAHYTYHKFLVGRFQAGAEDNSFSLGAGSRYRGGEYGIYVADDWQPTPAWSFQYGVRLSGFLNQGTSFAALEPRAAVRYSLTENTALKASFTSMRQYIHLVSNSGASLPTDIWYPSNSTVKPQRSTQVALGWSHLFKGGEYLFTHELYYKWMKNQIDFKDGAQLFVNDNLDKEFLFGRGDSYGSEFYLEKKTGRTTGWLGYTLSWSNRKFAEINNGKRFPTRADRRHDITAVIMHQLAKRWQITGTWVYGTGSAYSLPVGRFGLQGPPGEDISVVPVYLGRNQFRLAAYHRMDLGLVYKLRPRRGESDLTFSVYNAYNRRNPYFVYFDEIKIAETDIPQAYKAKQVSLFPVIPSVTYNFKF
ncbi:TonB-dependent receptor [Adhaeribacter radiodurans]|uniref:TonB-dependent receptor n=1 Tax=Adhaeribacter radiodurans TaxID=2745197 RepID=A0A7L7L4R6_9BACT|nr:TonB-dependent receptor [Adhaeribacter radiodurans]QMU27797.1 TonB-dependent receptor [Adhaeribacter radiodurans]